MQIVHFTQPLLIILRLRASAKNYPEHKLVPEAALKTAQNKCYSLKMMQNILIAPWWLAAVEVMETPPTLPTIVQCASVYVFLSFVLFF